MTSMEAYLRLMSYKIVQMSDKVAAMPIHLEGQENLVFEEGHESDLLCLLGTRNKLTGFFSLCNRNDEDGKFARTLRYNQVAKFFSWNYQYKRWVRRTRNEVNKIVKFKH